MSRRSKQQGRTGFKVRISCRCGRGSGRRHASSCDRIRDPQQQQQSCEEPCRLRRRSRHTLVARSVPAGSWRAQRSRQAFRQWGGSKRFPMQWLHPPSVSSASLRYHTLVPGASCIALSTRRIAKQEELSDRGCFEQGPSGCDAIDWEQSQASYLRQILVARVYEVAVRPQLSASCTLEILASIYPAGSDPLLQCC